MLEQIEAKYGLKLPRSVITIDYDEDVGDLYIRFLNTDVAEGGKIAAIEITDITLI